LPKPRVERYHPLTVQQDFQQSWGGGTDAALSVSLLTKHLASLVREDVILQDVWIRGEVLNVTRAASGHLYFSLKDSDATIGCVMFRSAAWRLRFRPENGVQVLAHGAVEIYPQRGQYQLLVDVLRPSGQGAAAMALERSRARLMEEGLLDPLRKRPLPPFPEKVAVVTSLAGAAIHDICTTLQRSPYPPDIVIVPSQVQGEQAEAGLCEALRLAGEHSGAALILLARGGGGAEDLWAFNGEQLARQICASPLPVISAVGHETDTTLADLAADLRVPTPTAGAELITSRRHEVILRAQSASFRARDLLRSRLAYSRLRWEGLTRRSPLARPGWMVEQRRQVLDDLALRLKSAQSTHLAELKGRLGSLAGKLDGLSPLGTLARGYAAVSKLDGSTVTRAAQLMPGEAARVRMADGSLDVKVMDLELGEQTG
jgi:exodeoxyribonuclease VII large subunit